VLLAALLGAAFTTPAFAKSDLETINRIRNEGLYHSQVMTTLQHLTDRIGPRLTGSPEMQQASAWTVEQLKAWGLSNVDLEGFEFGRGWSFDSAQAKLLHPREAPLMGLPVAWTPGSNGVIEGDVVFVDAVTEAELEKYRGKIAGKIVLLSEPKDIGEPRSEIFTRYSSDDRSRRPRFDCPEPQVARVPGSGRRLPEAGKRQSRAVPQQPRWRPDPRVRSRSSRRQDLSGAGADPVIRALPIAAALDRTG
jgi:hypothetical protein